MNYRPLDLTINSFMPHRRELYLFRLRSLINVILCRYCKLQVVHFKTN